MLGEQEGEESSRTVLEKAGKAGARQCRGTGGKKGQNWRG
jgi:hypothetical protein